MNLKQHFKARYFALPLATLCLAPQAFANPSLEQRVAALEEKAQIKNQGEAWYDRIALSGLIEVEASYSDPDSGSSESDIVIATAELGAEAAITEDLSANLVLLYEEGEGGIDVDIATLNYQLGEGFSFVLGQDYLPFGAYSTALVSDTLALQLGETNETALVAHYEQGGLSGAFYLFNGDNEEQGEEKIDDYGVRISFSNDALTVGGDYTSNLANSGGLVDEINDDELAGAALFAEVKLGAITVFAEHLSALDGYAAENNAEPSASQLEAAIDVGRYTYAASYQQTDEAEFLDFPEERLSIGLSTDLVDSLAVGVELARDEAYNGDKTNNVVVLFSAEF